MDTEESYKFDEVEFLSAVAVGAPGKRTFFLIMGKKNNWLRIWVEKEHLQALALGIEQLLFNLEQEHIPLPQESEENLPAEDIPSKLPSAELEIVQMTLGYKEERAIIELVVQRSGSQEDNPAEVYCQATITQLKNLRRQAKTVCAAGRPLCPVCGGPIDPEGHMCPKLN